jgi:ABC-2 type transport system ATP-binding protein
MRQRLGLAAVLLAPRRLVVLDEPTNGLDPAGTLEVRRLIRELRAEGSTVLVSSHLLTEVERICTDVAVLVSGSVVAAGELEALRRAAGPALVVQTGEPARALGVLRTEGMRAYPERDAVVVDLTRSAPEGALRALVRADVPVTEARRRRIGLEELFLQLTETDSE